jgi:hypothetical protein
VNTPRTDAIAAKDFMPDPLWIAHARKLERELAVLTSERDQLRAEVERLTYNSSALRKPWRFLARVERAEAELAVERARLDWLDENAGDIHRFNSNRYIIFSSQNLRAAIDSAMKEGAK